MKVGPNKRRIMVYHHYGCDDRLDEHILYQLRAFADFGIDILFVSNSRLAQEEQVKIFKMVMAITIRDNEGFDWRAWRQVLLSYGQAFFNAYDELLLANCSCYGPLFPLSELFDKMDQEICDFWMPTNHLESMGFPMHGQPYLAVIRKPLLSSDVFWSFWDTLPPLRTMPDAVWQGEIKFYCVLLDAGYACRFYYDVSQTEAVPEIGHVDPLCMNASDFLIVKARMPFIKVKSVTERFSRHYSIAGYLFESLRVTKSTYPLELIANHIRRTQAVSCQKSLPGSVALLSESDGASKGLTGRIAACGFFKNSQDFVVRMGGGQKISISLDLLALVDNEACAGEIRETITREYPCFHTLSIRVCPTHSQKKTCLLQTFQDVFDQYDYMIMVREHNALNIPEVMMCRMGPPWLPTILAAEGRMAQIFRMFHSEAGLGLVAPVIPPILAIGKRMPLCLDAGLTQKLNKVGIRFRQETYVPVLTTGSSIVRSSILRQLADHIWTQKNAVTLENVSDDDLLDVLPYVAQAFGFYYKQVIVQDALLSNLSLYEDFICSVQFKNKIIHYNLISFKEMCSELLKTLQGYLFYRFPGISRIRTRLRCSRKGIPISGG